MVGTDWLLAARLLPHDPDFYGLAVRRLGQEHIWIYQVEPALIPFPIGVWGEPGERFPAGLDVIPDSG